MSEKKWIFQSAGQQEMSVVLKPTTYDTQTDGSGNVSFRTTVKPVYLRFVGSAGRCIVDKAYAEKIGVPGVTPEVIAEWALASVFCGKQYHCILSPDKVATKEEVAKIEQEDGAAIGKVKVQQGVRSRASKGQ